MLCQLYHQKRKIYGMIDFPLFFKSRRNKTEHLMFGRKHKKNLSVIRVFTNVIIIRKYNYSILIIQILSPGSTQFPCYWNTELYNVLWIFKNFPIFLELPKEQRSFHGICWHYHQKWQKKKKPATATPPKDNLNSLNAQINTKESTP